MTPEQIIGLVLALLTGGAIAGRVVDAKGRLSITYEAPAIVYFQRGLADFEAVVTSVRFR